MKARKKEKRKKERNKERKKRKKERKKKKEKAAFELVLPLSPFPSLPIYSWSNSIFYQGKVQLHLIEAESESSPAAAEERESKLFPGE